MKILKKRIRRLLEEGEIMDDKERLSLDYLITTKKWNPYCIRHVSITADSDYLPEYALKKKVRWSMNSKQGARYIKTRMGNDLKEKILNYNGIIQTEIKKKSTINDCPRCELANVIENKYCSKCSYPLKPEAYDELKSNEENRIRLLELKYQNDMRVLKRDMENKFQLILNKINLVELQ